MQIVTLSLSDAGLELDNREMVLFEDVARQCGVSANTSLQRWIKNHCGFEPDKIRRLDGRICNAFEKSQAIEILKRRREMGLL